MRFYHGTSVRGWLGIIKSGSMDSKKIGDSRVSALYSKFKGNYLTTNRKIAEMYASKAGKGVVLEIEYDPLAPGRVNNFKEQQAAGKDYFVEETPLQVDGPDCFIDTKDPLMTKAKMRGDINKTNEEIYMSENTERELRNAWQKLDEAFKMPGVMHLIGEGAGQDAVYMYISDAIQELMSEYPQHAEQIKALEPQIMDDAAHMGGEGMRIDYDFVYNSTKDAVIDAGIDLDAPPMPAQPEASASMFEDRNKIESIYEFGGQILDSAEAQGFSLDETQIDAANQRIVSALQGEGMSNPHNLEAIIDDAVADAAYQGSDHADGVGGGIMESIDRSLGLLKQLKK